MRLGGPIFEKTTDPERWALAVRRAGYRAAVCPLEPGADADALRLFRRAAADKDIVIAEVGAWCNPISPDDSIRRAAILKCQEHLQLADLVAARCCVNVPGSRGTHWCGPHPDDLSDATFDLIVDSVREIIDAVRPVRTYYTLEMMPWVHPNAHDTYLKLIQAIDRPRFGVHFDPVNVINSPYRYYENARLLQVMIQALGPHLRSCHAKDVLLSDKMVVHLDEVRPGLGKLDYATFLREIEKIDPDMPLIMEHLDSAQEYEQAAQYIRSVAQQENVSI